MERYRAAAACAWGATWGPMAGSSRGHQWYLLEASHWCALARPAGALRPVADVRGSPVSLAAGWDLGPHSGARADPLGCRGRGRLGSEYRLHDNRHTHASHLVSSGLSLEIVGRLLGHTNPTTTKRYAHIADSPLRAAAERFGAKLNDLHAGRKAEIVPLKLPK